MWEWIFKIRKLYKVILFNLNNELRWGFDTPWTENKDNWFKVAKVNGDEWSDSGEEVGGGDAERDDENEKRKNILVRVIKGKNECF